MRTRHMRGIIYLPGLQLRRNPSFSMQTSPTACNTTATQASIRSPSLRETPSPSTSPEARSSRIPTETSWARLNGLITALQTNTGLACRKHQLGTGPFRAIQPARLLRKQLVTIAVGLLQTYLSERPTPASPSRKTRSSARTWPPRPPTSNRQARRRTQYLQRPRKSYPR